MLLSFCVVIATCGLGVHGGIFTWEDRPYGNNDFNTQAEFQANKTLECTDDRVGGNSPIVQYWILPDLRVMHPGDYESFETAIDGTASWTVSPVTDDSKMYIVNVEARHFGFYYCVVHVTIGAVTEVMVVKKALNYQGPYFGDLWDHYEKNVIIACSASGGLIVIIIVIFFVDKFHYDPDKKKEKEVSLSDGSSVGRPSYVMDSDGGYDYSNSAYMDEMGDNDYYDISTTEL